MPSKVLANLAGSASCLRYSYAPNLHHSFAKLLFLHTLICVFVLARQRTAPLSDAPSALIAFSKRLARARRLIPRPRDYKYFTATRLRRPRKRGSAPGLATSICVNLCSSAVRLSFLYGFA
jgi:hypothetical protein